MRILDNNKTYQVSIEINLVADFIEAIFLTAKKDDLLKIGDEMEFKIHGDFNEFLSNMEKNISRFMKQELDYFFDFNIGGIGYLGFLNYFYENTDIQDINQMINIIEASDTETFIFNITRSIIDDYIDITEQKHLFKEKNYTKLIDIISKKENDLVIKEKLIESIENPIEAKQRFCLLLRQFYQKSYKIFENKILDTLTHEKDKYEKLLKKGAKFFFTQYTKNDISFYSSEKTLIFPSFSKHVGVCSFLRNKQSILIIGIKNNDFYGKKAVKERLHRFFKVLCDKKRLDIIDLLGERPHYVQEMAEKLELTSATISYHLNFLFGLDLVYCERDEHRIYYSLNKEKAHEMFDEAVKLLLHE